MLAISDTQGNSKYVTYRFMRWGLLICSCAKHQFFHQVLGFPAPPHSELYSRSPLPNCFLILFIFNWRLIALQCCVGFCHTSTWSSHRCTHVPSFLNLPPSPYCIPPLSVVTGHEAELPVSFGKSHWLAIPYMVIYGFQFAPALPFPAVSTSLWSVCNSTAALWRGSYVPSF